jgi:hypothetical protein
MVGAAHLLVDLQRALEERLRRRIGSSAMKIFPSPIQKMGVVCVCGGVSRFHLADCKDMRRQQRAAWP